MTPSDIAAASQLLAQRAQLQSRVASIKDAQTLDDVLRLLENTAVQPNAVLAQAQQAIGAFFQNAIAGIEAQLAAMGVTLS